MLLSLVCLTAQILKVSFHIYGDTPIQRKEHMGYLPQEYRFEFLSLRKTYPTYMSTMQVVCVFSSLFCFIILHKKSHSKFFSSRRDIG